MHELSQINEISPFQAILWCFYPIGFVVLLELVLRTNDNDDDDDAVSYTHLTLPTNSRV